MLTVLEGLDGAGKSTQVKKLRAYLEGVFGSLEYIHFPRYDAPVYGDLISRFLRGDFGDNSSVHPQLVALLFAEDRHGAAIPGLISFRMDCLDLLAVQGTLKSLVQHHSSKASILRHSAFFTVQLSHPYMTTGKTIALTRWTFVGRVMSLLLNE